MSDFIVDVNYMHYYIYNVIYQIYINKCQIYNLTKILK